MDGRTICHIAFEPMHSIPRVLREARSAAQAGYTVYIIAQGQTHEKDGIYFIGFPESKGRLNRILYTSRKMVERAVALHADIYQLHDPEFLFYSSSLRRTRGKIIFDSHEFYAMQIQQKGYLPHFSRAAVSRVYAWYEKQVCLKLDCVLYPCTIGGKNYFDGRAKRSLKIENYSFPTPIPEKTGDGERRAIYAGALTRNRGLFNLADAIQKTDGKLILCGNFSSPQEEEVFLRTYSPEKVQYLGVLSREELFRQYTACSVGLCTLLAVGQYKDIDNLSTKIYEYMQCGLPVVMSDFTYAQAVNEKYHFGICVDPENNDAIADAIGYLFDHPEEARAMGENGHRAVEQEFNWETQEKKLLALYKDLLGGN